MVTLIPHPLLPLLEKGSKDFFKIPLPEGERDLG